MSGAASTVRKAINVATKEATLIAHPSRSCFMAEPPIMSWFFRAGDDSIIPPLFAHNKVLHNGSCASKTELAGKKSLAASINQLR
jgi:hypothetical protein